VRCKVTTGEPIQPAADPGWTPTFPADRLAKRDPNDPSTWLRSFACDGHDRHALSMPLRLAASYGAGGAVLTILDVSLHVYGRSLGVGIGLMLLPGVAVFFARWVDGPVLSYRSWGRVHRLRLTSVTDVSVGRRAAGLQLNAPGLAKPFRLALRSPGYVLPQPARDHLRGWLTAPGVHWSPEAVALFGDDAAAAGAPTIRRRHRLLATLLTVVLPLSAAGIGVAWLIHHRRPSRPIAGAPGYRTFGGPHGKPLAIGRPWGRPCQPIRFTVEEHVPDWVYTQVDAVVAEARRDGIDVTLETRSFAWSPTSLYYARGQSPATVARVAIFAKDGSPPRLSDGGVEHIRLGWDARVDADGRHEDVTYADGRLWMQALAAAPQAVRRSIRQLVALTQGIIGTSSAGSGIARNTAVDRFSSADVAAMRLMSGCGDAAGPVVSATG
jgi:hypothetical protein